MIGLLLLLFIPQHSVFAQEALDIPSPTPTMAPVDYTLPYPGLLPDHPLYNVKAFRDRVIGFFISDPNRKAEYNLLQSDKRVNSANYLFMKGEQKYFLSESTLSKGLNYFEEALNQTRLAKNEGIRVEDILTKMEIASRKYDEVITNFVNETKGELKVSFENDLKRNKKLQEEVEKFRAKQ